MRSLISTSLFYVLLLITSVASQNIWDLWETTQDGTKSLFRRPNSDGLPIPFKSPGKIGQADIVVQDDQVFQNMAGFGASLTDSSAQLLSQLKTNNPTNYFNLLNELFNATYSVRSAGLSMVRVPIGASDFSSSVYSWANTAGTSSTNALLSSFAVGNSPSNIWELLEDIRAISPRIKIIAIPWSAPQWMKTSDTMLGGSFDSSFVSEMATYLLQAVQAFDNKGFSLYAIGIQNEPQNSNPTYPTSLLPAATEAQIATQLRQLMDNNGQSSVRILAYEHNWNTAASYPVQVVQQAESAIDGVTFHCYAGSVEDQDLFHNAFPEKEIYHTECTGSIGTDPWSNTKWYMDNLIIGVPEHNGMSSLMWNLALDSNGGPTLPGTNSCGEGCKGVVTIYSNGTYMLNEEFFTMAHGGMAINPQDPGGPFGQRIGVTVGGSSNGALRVGAYKTGRTNSKDPDRWALVVMNWQDHDENGNWDPQIIGATIEFRGQQATHAFQVGVTTMWWFA